METKKVKIALDKAVFNELYKQVYMAFARTIDDLKEEINDLAILEAKRQNPQLRILPEDLDAIQTRLNAKIEVFLERLKTDPNIEKKW